MMVRGRAMDGHDKARRLGQADGASRPLLLADDLIHSSIIMQATATKKAIRNRRYSLPLNCSHAMGIVAEKPTEA